MAVRRPLVLANGDVTELPSSDYLFGTREKLSAARTYYVRTDGNDSNTGLANTSAAAFLTMQKAVDTAAGLDLGTYDVTIRATGTFNETIFLRRLNTAGGRVNVRGDATNMTGFVLSPSTGSCVNTGNGFTGQYDFSYMKFAGLGGGIRGTAGGGGTITFSNVDWGQMNSEHIAAPQGCLVMATGPYQISGGAYAHAAAYDSAQLRIQNVTVTIINAPTFVAGFALGTRGGVILITGTTFTGSALGKKFDANQGGGILTFSGVNYLPGDTPGSVVSPGWYDQLSSDGILDRNRIINGKCEVANAVTSFANQTIGTGGVPVEMFVFIGSGSSAAQVTVSQQVDAPYGFRNSIRLLVTTAQPSTGTTDTSGIQTRIEGYNVSDLVGQTFTLSFWVKSPRVGTHSVGLYNSGFDRSYVAPYTVNAANTWEQKQIVVEGGLPSSGTWDFANGMGLAVRWNTTCGTQYQTSSSNTWVSGLYLGAPGQVNCLDTVNNIFALTGMQLRKGAGTLPYDHTPYVQELIQCRRYYQEYWGTSNGAFSFAGRGSPGGGNGIFFGMSLPVEMRVPPTATIVGTFVTGNCSQPVINAVSKNFISMVGNAATAGDAYYASQSSSVGFTLNARLQ
ncbi:tail fiber protein [Acidovorax phage ACP17]|uniref:Uncharacterized protein n=1 Tax=Acidovorax phage ACP17 TaxID=2010329 RepID=A0A218M356_9CAUD|nr:tail fiber protein [Acidovorax phage ACP17]ASD50471.1 hypothetical protein [Acidovorax phage ACP17]